MASTCEQCEELLSAYRGSARQLSELVVRFSEAAYSGEIDLAREVWSRSRDAYQKCEELRKLILLHLQAHKT
jgi:hypothetical protein